MKTIVMLMTAFVLIGCGQKEKDAKIKEAQEKAAEARREEVRKSAFMLSYIKNSAISDIRQEASQLTRVLEMRFKLRSVRGVGESTLLAMDLKKETDKLDEITKRTDDTLETLYKRMSENRYDQNEKLHDALINYREALLKLADDYGSQWIEDGWQKRQQDYFKLDRIEESEIIERFSVVE